MKLFKKCGLQWRKLVKLFKKSKSHFYWYDFTVRGQRYRGSTKESSSTRAAKIAGLKLVLALAGCGKMTVRPNMRSKVRDLL